MLHIEIVTNKGESLHNIDLQSNPFKVKEIITLDITNSDPDGWDVNELNEGYVVTRICYTLKKHYRKHNSVTVRNTVYVVVEKYDELKHGKV